MIIIGIDPGIKGGICLMDERGDIISVNPMPPRIEDIVYIVYDIKKSDTGISYIERPYLDNKGRRQKGIDSFFIGYGKILSVLEICGIEYKEVSPSTWQSVMKIRGKGDTKKQALTLAKRMYPDINFKATPRCKVDHDGMVDALLIAYYGMLDIQDDL